MCRNKTPLFSLITDLAKVYLWYIFISCLNMVENVKGILEKHKDEIKERFGVKSIGLFGSCARGEEDEKSDVDVIVEFGEPNFDDFMDLVFYLEDLFDRPVDILTPAGLKGIRIPEVSEEISRSVVYV